MQKNTYLLLAFLAALIAGCLAPPSQNATTTATPLVTLTPSPTITPTPTATPTSVPKTIISTSCSSDADCAWQNTACCGGDWKCVNEKETSVYCPPGLGCPVRINDQTGPCMCVKKSCFGGEINFTIAAQRIEDAVNRVLNKTLAPNTSFTFNPILDYRNNVELYESTFKEFVSPGSVRAAPASRRVEFVLTLKAPTTTGSGSSYFEVQQNVDGRSYSVHRGTDVEGNVIETKAAFTCGNGKFLVTINDQSNYDYLFSGFWHYDYYNDSWVNTSMKDFVATLMKACPA